MRSQFILSLLILLVIGEVQSQNLQGKAVYKTKRQVNIQLDSTQFNDQMRKEMEEQIRSHSQKDFTLSFNQNESLYKENDKLGKPVTQTSGIRMEISASKNVLYKNISEATFTEQRDIMGKTFLVQDSLAVPGWKLEKETKMIGRYTCFKATRTREVSQRVYNSNQKEAKETIKEITTTVWYTPEIPVQHGPGQYWGLPGLILEVQEDNFNILCSEIIMNPGEDLELEKPSKGKLVSQEEYIKIQEEKSREMMERYGNGKDGNIIMIRSGS